MSTDIKTMYQQSLRNTHAAERQGLTEMQSQVEGLGDYPDYAALLRRHIATTEQQIARLDAAIQETEAGGAGLREAVTAAVGAIGTAVHGIMPDATLKNLYAGYAYQYEQIGAYLSLAVIAEAAGYAQHKGWIDQSVEEERSAAAEVEALIATVTRTFIAKNGK